MCETKGLRSKSKWSCMGGGSEKQSKRLYRSCGQVPVQKKLRPRRGGLGRDTVFQNGSLKINRGGPHMGVVRFL